MQLGNLNLFVHTIMCSFLSFFFFLPIFECILSLSIMLNYHLTVIQLCFCLFLALLLFSSLFWFLDPLRFYCSVTLCHAKLSFNSHPHVFRPVLAIEIFRPKKKNHVVFFRFLDPLRFRILLLCFTLICHITVITRCFGKFWHFQFFHGGKKIEMTVIW